MAKWLVCQSCGKPFTTLHLKHGVKAHFTNRTVNCTRCGTMNILNGEYMVP